MQALNSYRDLHDYRLCLGLGQGLYRLLYHVIEQVARRHKLRDHEEVFRVLQRLNVLQYVQTTHLGALAHNLQFLERLRLLSERPFNRSLVHQFYGHIYG